MFAGNYMLLGDGESWDIDRGKDYSRWKEDAEEQLTSWRRAPDDTAMRSRTIRAADYLCSERPSAVGDFSCVGTILKQEVEVRYAILESGQSLSSTELDSGARGDVF